MNEKPMIKTTLCVKSRRGLTVQQVMELSAAACRFDARILFQKSDQTVNAKSIIAMLNAGFSYGTEFEVNVEGADETEAMEMLRGFFNH